MDQLKTVNSYVIVIGIDGPKTPNQILKNCKHSIEAKITKNLSLEHNEIYIDSKSGKQSELQLEGMSDKTIHLQQYEIGVDSDNSYNIERLRSLVENTLQTQGFNVTEIRSQKVQNKAVPKSILEG